MTKQEIIEELYKTEFVKAYTKKLYGTNHPEWIEDRINDAYVCICSLPDERIISMYKQGGINFIRKYAAGVIFRINSNTGPSGRMYNKEVILNDPDLSQENIAEPSYEPDFDRF